MTLRFPSFPVSCVIVSLSLASAVACGSDSSSNDETSSSANNTANTSSATGTPTTTGVQTTATVGSTTVTNTVTTTASATTVTNTTASGTTSTTAGSSSNSTTGAATTGAGGGTGTGTGASSSSAGGAGGTGGGGPTEFTLTSPAFADDGMCSDEMPDTCELFPSANSSFVDNENPELNWTAGPEGTLSYLIVFHDLSNGFGHWAIWGLGGDLRQVPAALPGDAMLTTPIEAEQTNASFAEGNGYFGPGSCENVYEFKIYALNVADFTPANAMSPDTIQDELEGSGSDVVVGTATLRGRANPEDSTQPCN